MWGWWLGWARALGVLGWLRLRWLLLGWLRLALGVALGVLGRGGILGLVGILARLGMAWVLRLHGVLRLAWVLRPTWVLRPAWVLRLAWVLALGLAGIWLLGVRLLGVVCRVARCLWIGGHRIGLEPLEHDGVAELFVYPDEGKHYWHKKDQVFHQMRDPSIRICPGNLEDHNAPKNV